MICAEGIKLEVESESLPTYVRVNSYKVQVEISQYGLS